MIYDPTHKTTTGDNCFFDNPWPSWPEYPSTTIRYIDYDKDKRIKELEDEIKFLRSVVEKLLNKSQP